NQTFTYDARGKRTSMHDPFGRDSSVYNVLGQLIFSEKAERHDLRITEYSLDALGNIISRSGAEASYFPGWWGLKSGYSASNDGEEWNKYHPYTGRLYYSSTANTTDTIGDTLGAGGRPASMNWYDDAGNLTWTGPAVLA